MLHLLATVIATNIFSVFSFRLSFNHTTNKVLYQTLAWQYKLFTKPVEANNEGLCETTRKCFVQIPQRLCNVGNLFFQLVARKCRIQLNSVTAHIAVSIVSCGNIFFHFCLQLVLIDKFEKEFSPVLLALTHETCELQMDCRYSGTPLIWSPTCHGMDKWHLRQTILL